MESTQTNFNHEYMTHVCSTDMVNLQQTHVRPIWITPSRRDRYKKFNFSRPPFDPLTFVGAEVGPSLQTIDCHIEKVVNPTTTSIQIQNDTGVLLPSHIQGTLTITPTTPPLQPTTPYIHITLLGHLCLTECRTLPHMYTQLRDKS
jgi:hypothetical protein